MIQLIRRPHASNQKEIQSTFWFIIAAAVSALIVLSPVEVAAGGLVIIVLVLMALITPFAAIITLLVLAPLRTLIATEAVYLLPLDIGQLLFIMTLGLWSVYRIARHRPELRYYYTPLYIPVITLIAVMCLTVFPAVSVSAWLTEVLKWVLILVLVLLVLNIGRNNLWEWLVVALVLAGTANALVGIYIFFGGSGADHLLINERFFRAFGTFGQPNPFGGFLGITGPIAIMAAYGYTGRLYRFWKARQHISFTHGLVIVFYTITSAIIGIGLFTSWSRGAWLSFVIASGVMAVALPRKLWHSVIMIALVGVTVGVLWFSGLLPDSVVARISSSTEDFFAFEDMRGIDITTENYAVAERLAHWQAALNMTQSHPFLGVGMGNYEIVYDQYRLINWKEPLGHAHNYYLNILAEAGIIGFSAYFALWLIVAWLTWQTRHHPDPLGRAIAIGLLGAWSYLAFHSFLDNLYVNNVFIHLGIMFGILALLYNQTWKTIHVELT